jgi:ribosomal protein S18 acetylase RimI-like enzyme
MVDRTDVRAATPGDAAAVESVAAAAWDHDYPSVLSRERPGEAARDWYDAERIRGDIEDPAHVVRVAERGDGVVGFVHAFAAATDTGGRDEGSILRLYVHPDARGEGVGSLLLDDARDSLSERGCDRVRAMVLAANEAGRAFYEACGFEETDETGTTVIDGEPYDEVVFVDDRRS